MKAQVRRCLLAWQGLLLAVLLAPVLAPAPLYAAAVPLRIDLDKFDAMKKTVALPNGVKIAYVGMGDPHGHPVVLIHGYTDNARDWVPLVPFLSKADRLILVDIRGHGASGKPECCYSRFDFAYDIKLLLDALHVQKADIVGHSLGSVIAQTFAEFWPERTGRVVLVSSFAAPLHADFSEIRKLKEPVDPDSPFMLAWWSSPNPVDADFMRRQRADSARIPLRVWWAVLDQAIGGASLVDTLPRLTAPVLLIWGSDDFIVKEADREPLRQALPSAQVKIFAGLGHNPFWEDPSGVADVINGFLAAGH